MDNALQLRSIVHYLRVALDQSSEGVMIVQPAMNDPRIVYVNQSVELLTGYSVTDLLGNSLDMLLARSTDWLQSLCINQAALHGEAELQRKNGDVLLCGWKFAPVCDASGAVAGVTVTIVPLKKAPTAQANVAVAEPGLSRVAVGIAHDFNNALQKIQGALTLLRLQLNGQTQYDGVIEQAMLGVQHGSALARKVLDFHKGRPSARKPLALAAVLDDIIPLAGAGSGIEIHGFCSPSVWSVAADRTQAAQVIYNLLVNAREAMENQQNMVADGGHIIVRAENVEIDDSDEIMIPGRYVRIMVRDHGPGIPEDIQERIFEHLFTTKRNGSGIGLAESRVITREHGGDLRVVSQIGKGADFLAYFPASSTEAIRENATGATQIIRGSGRVLLVDDDQTLRMLSGRILRELGYDTLEAASGEDAIEIVKHQQLVNPIDLILLDNAMPGGLSGVETMKILRESYPNLKIIACSGYVTGNPSDSLDWEGFDGVLSKPFDIQEISHVIFETIHAKHVLEENPMSVRF